MRHISKAVFTDQAKARQALEALRAAGYPASDASLATEPASERAEHMEEHKTPAWRQASTAAGHFLSRMFGHEEAPGMAAGQDAAPACTLILETDSDDDDVRAAQLVPALRRIDSGPAPETIPEPGQTARRASHHPGTAPGALQFYGRDTSHFFGTREASDLAPGGTTFREPMTDPGQWLDAGLEQDEPAGAVAGPPGGGGSRAAYVRRPAAGSTRFAQSLFKRAPGADPASVWKRRHPGELPPWERYVDAPGSGFGGTTARMDEDEAGYRRHHAARYPGTDYKDLAPVYRYGRRVRDRAAFRGRSWDEVETELRAEWERGCREANAAKWDEMKDAVREGWEHGSPGRQAGGAD